MNAVTPLRSVQRAGSASPDTEEYLTFAVAGHHFAVCAVDVRDVLRLQLLTPVPLGRSEVAGLMNLRGHIVTAFDLRIKLGFGEAASAQQRMSIVIERAGEAYCFVVDTVGDVITCHPSEIESNPASMEQGWSTLSNGIFKMKDKLFVILDIASVLGPSEVAA